MGKIKETQAQSRTQTLMLSLEELCLNQLDMVS